MFSRRRLALPLQCSLVLAGVMLMSSSGCMLSRIRSHRQMQELNERVESLEHRVSVIETRLK